MEETKCDICNGGETTSVYFNGDVGLLKQVQNFQYVCCNIPGPGTDLTLFEELLDGCVCTATLAKSCDLSAESKCSCVGRYGRAYDDAQRLILPESSSSDSCRERSVEDRRAPIVECNSLCTCSQSCKTRVVQNGVQCHLEVFVDNEKGFCLRTLQSLKTNTFVCEYAGEILTLDEAKRRMHEQTVSDMNYIFILREHCASGIITTCVDPTRVGNIGRFLNHSCDPNLFMVPVRVHNTVPKLCLFVRRDIEAGEELTYSYGDSSFSSVDHSGSSSQGTSNVNVGNVHLKPCKCMAVNCTKFLPFDASLL